MDEVSEDSDENEKNMLEIVLMGEEERENYEKEQRLKMYMQKKGKLERKKK